MAKTDLPMCQEPMCSGQLSTERRRIVARVFRRLRYQKGWTQKELAANARVPKWTVVQIESRARTHAVLPRQEYVDRILRGLDTTDADVDRLADQWQSAQRSLGRLTDGERNRLVCYAVRDVVGEHLKGLGLTQGAIAEKAGVSRELISKIMCGRAPFRQQTEAMQNVAIALGLSPSDFVKSVFEATAARRVVHHMTSDSGAAPQETSHRLTELLSRLDAEDQIVRFLRRSAPTTEFSSDSTGPDADTLVDGALSEHDQRLLHPYHTLLWHATLERLLPPAALTRKVMRDFVLAVHRRAIRLLLTSSG